MSDSTLDSLKKADSTDYGQEGDLLDAGEDSAVNTSPVVDEEKVTLKYDEPTNDLDQSKEAYILTILQNRYNQEVEKITRLRNQCIFLLTATGFLVSITFGIMGANWFELSFIYQIPAIVYVLLGVEVFLCIIPAVICLSLVSVSVEKHYVLYPSNDLYIVSVNKNSDIDNIRNYVGNSFSEVCIWLKKYTSTYVEKNSHHRKYIKWSALGLVSFFITLVVLILVLIFVIAPGFTTDSVLLPICSTVFL